MKKYLLTILVTLVFSGCVTMNPVVRETRSVTKVADSENQLTVPNGMVFYDTRPPKQGIRFPAGTYKLVAEDDEYLYFKSDAPIEIRNFSNGTMTGGDNYSGGLMIAKGISIVPGAGFIKEENDFVMIWKLGGEFLRLEGREWSRK